MFQFSNDWRFTKSCKESMKNDLDALREILTQMKSIEKEVKEILMIDIFTFRK